MWTIPDDYSCSTNQFDGFTPSEVLYDFNGPRIFTTLTGRQLYLWYQCGEDSDGTTDRFSVVPTNSRIVEQLKVGTKTVHDALNQPWVWVVNVSAGRVTNGWVLKGLDELPCNAKPHPDTPLWPHLEPLFSYRLIGEGLREGEIPASVVARAISGPTYALKGLIDVVNRVSSTVGRPAEDSRKLYGVVAKRFAFNSFEVAFDVPASTISSSASQSSLQLELPVAGTNPSSSLAIVSSESTYAVDGAPIADLAIYSNSRDELGSALNWLTSNDSSVPPPSLSHLAVLEHLVPPRNGLITAAEIKGKLAGKYASTILTREYSSKVKQAISAHKERHRSLVTTQGRVGEFDKDKLQCTLRDQPDNKPEIVCTFQEELYDDLFDAFNSDTTVIVQGRQSSAGRALEIIAIEQAEIHAVEVSPSLPIVDSE
jgi:hypothetical protein